MNIRQIAYLAGVSVATVSRCINQPEKVSEETRNHIIGVMKRVDYIPNPSAKSLSTGYTKTILCVIPTPVSYTQLDVYKRQVSDKEEGPADSGDCQHIS